MPTHCPKPAPRCHLLLPCAGTGSRAGSALPKQYVALAGRALVAHTLAALVQVARLQTMLVLLAADDHRFEQQVPAELRANVTVARCGGPTRDTTVRNGLAELVARGARPDDWVLVHDAARCLIRPEWVERLIAACDGDTVGGLLALPLADTLKVERDGRVAATLERSGKWQAQTPQMFRLGLLGAALARAAPGTTDEAGAVEALGHAPKLVLGALENFKVTFPADFELAERLLQSRGNR